MKHITILLLAAICTASTSGIEIPSKKPPKLDASDIAWMEGISYTKGLLPNKDNLRLNTVELVLDYENGKRDVVIDSTPIRYY